MDKPIYSKMPAEIQSLSSQALGDALIQRVSSLMTVPFDKLPKSDRDERRALASRRLRETLCLIPWYANKAEKAAAQGNELAYWESLWGSQVNLLHPPVASSSGEAT